MGRRGRFGPRQPPSVSSGFAEDGEAVPGINLRGGTRAAIFVKGREPEGIGELFFSSPDAYHPKRTLNYGGFCAGPAHD